MTKSSLRSVHVFRHQDAVWAISYAGGVSVWRTAFRSLTAAMEVTGWVVAGSDEWAWGRLLCGA